MQVRELLEQVKVRILADPAMYNQNSFCNTACCIAGHIDCVINGEEAHNLRHGRDGFEQAIKDVEEVALLALGEKYTPWLFGCAGGEEDFDEDGLPDAPEEIWPLGLCREYWNAATSRERAEVGCRAIDRYLEERETK